MTVPHNITEDDLLAALKGDPSSLDVHLILANRDIVINGYSTRVHCHCLTVDANGRVQVGQLAEFMRRSAVDYAIPRARIEEAKARDTKFNSTEAVSALVDQARALFTDLKQTGEGGELLLFLLAERFLKLPQILCKMDLKTDSRMHYHGADGVYAGITPDHILKLYWGESKIYKNVGDAIRSCIASLAPFLTEDDDENATRSRDLFLLSDKADLRNAEVSAAIRRYFDRDLPSSRRVEYCGIALVGFDASFYTAQNGKLDGQLVSTAAISALNDWCKLIGSHLKSHNLNSFEIQFLCLPLPSADDFRDRFLKAMGISS